MLPLIELFDFIKSLSKTEKRYVKVELMERAPEKAYATLYRVLADLPALESPEKQLLRNHFKPQQLEIARKHLGRKLMHAMSRYHLQHDPEFALWERYAEARVLLQKGFFQAGMRHVLQGKRASSRWANPYFYGMFCKLELRCGVEHKFADWTEDRLIALHQTVRDNREEEKAMTEHASLYELLLCRYWKKGTARNHLQRAQLNDLVLEEHQIVTHQRAETFGSARLHLHFQSVYFMVIGDPEGSLKAFYSLDELFQQHQPEWTESPEPYIRFLQDALETLRRFEYFDHTDYYLRRMEAVPRNGQSDRISILLAEHRLHIALATGSAQFYDAPDPLPSSWHDQAYLREAIQWWFTVARLHLAQKDYPRALKLTNKLLEVPVSVTGKMDYAKIRMLNLMVHHAMQNRDFLAYEIRSFERKMKKEDAWHRTEKLVVEYLKHWLAYKPFDKLKSDIAHNLKDPYEQVMVSELGLKSWLRLAV